MRRTLLPIVALSTLCGCGGGAADGARAAAEALWRAKKPVRYGFTLRRSCFCPPESLGPFRVTVRDGVSTVVRADDDQPVSDETVPGSVEALFAVARRYGPGSGAAVTARYDTRYGFPELLAVDPIPAAVDDEFSWSVSDFSPEP